MCSSPWQTVYPSKCFCTDILSQQWGNNYHTARFIGMHSPNWLIFVFSFIIINTTIPIKYPIKTQFQGTEGWNKFTMLRQQESYRAYSPPQLWAIEPLQSNQLYSHRAEAGDPAPLESTLWVKPRGLSGNTGMKHNCYSIHIRRLLWQQPGKVGKSFH